MGNNSKLLVGSVLLAGGVVVVWLCASIQGGEKTYEVHPYVGIPEYRTDAARAIDAYERLMKRYMDLTESNLVGIAADVQKLANKLDSIDAKLTRLDTRIARLEKALGIQAPLPAPGKKPDQSQPTPRKESEPPAERTVDEKVGS